MFSFSRDVSDDAAVHFANWLPVMLTYYYSSSIDENLNEDLNFNSHTMVCLCI